MGDRCNIVMKQEGNEGYVFFYGHWSGSDFVHAVQRALKKKWRWDDAAYLARIIWDEFCLERGQETGFGIATRLIDNEHDLCVIDVEKKLVTRCKENTSSRSGRDCDIGASVQSWSFDEFINLTQYQIDKMEW